MRSTRKIYDKFEGSDDAVSLENYIDKHKHGGVSNGAAALLSDYAKDGRDGHPACIKVLLENFAFNDNKIRNALKESLSHNNLKCTMALLQDNMHILDIELMQSIIEHDNAELLHFVLAAPQVKNKFINFYYECGDFNLPEWAMLQKKYNAIAEFANAGADFDRMLAIGGSRS